ncbi:hypothetical protein I3760_01G108100 [Carya illinoinensis]|nr:hypothetical protein I3760_01G108100 [Carya illinoinensis]
MESHRLDTGNYSWGSEAVTRKIRMFLQCFILLMGWPPLDVVYNASNNELVRTQTLVKSAFVHVDAARFKLQWWLLRRKPTCTIGRFLQIVCFHFD